MKISLASFTSFFPDAVRKLVAKPSMPAQLVSAPKVMPRAYPHQASALRLMQKFARRPDVHTKTGKQLSQLARRMQKPMRYAPVAVARQPAAMSLARQPAQRGLSQKKTAPDVTGTGQLPDTSSRQWQELQRRHKKLQGLDPDKTTEQHWQELQRRHKKLQGLDPDKTTEQHWQELQRRHQKLKGIDPDKSIEQTLGDLNRRLALLRDAGPDSTRK